MSAANKTPSSVSLVKVGGFANGGVGASEIPAYDEVSKRIFVVNGAWGLVDVYDAQDPTAPVFVERFTLSGGANSVAASKGVVAVAVQAVDTVSNGTIHFFRTISDDESKAWVSLQENNALAVIDLASATVSQILPLGFKNHSLAGNGLDVSDRDSAINIRTWPVFGMYQPDAIGQYSVNGQTYIVTANEGDSRDYMGFTEEARVSTLSLDTSIFTSAICGGACNVRARLLVFIQINDRAPTRRSGRRLQRPHHEAASSLQSQRAYIRG